MTNIPFAISSSSSYSAKNNDSELINMYASLTEPGSKTNHILLNTPGLKQLITTSSNILGIYEFLDIIYIVTETKLMKYENGETTDIGDISLTGKVVFADNGIEMIFVSGDGYYYNPTSNILGNMQQDGWYSADTVAFMDGYFIFNRQGTGEFFITNLYSHVINPLDWATAESAPDDTVGVAVVNRQLWLIGKKSTEVWYDSGASDFPFARINGSVSNTGCVNPATISIIKANIFFVGNDNKVYITNGYTPSIVSTPAVEYNISRSNRNLIAFSYVEDGHFFYCLTISDTFTYCYDTSTAQWHKRISANYNRWIVQGVYNLYNVRKPLAFNKTSLYEMSVDYLDEAGTPIKREAISLPINHGVDKINIHEVQLDMETGFDTVNAKVGLQVSTDGGSSFGILNEAYTGNVGQHRTRVRWLRLGQMRDCIFKIVITDAIPIRILGLYMRAS